ncbi:Putative exonuclease of the beta-lactamase fold involved in RNA processing [Idiomarina sp. A28L]|uniref:MBL fold metallo-hydrolase RNA specificity domain-containing protein n=1 Tax=Idiomarina sp. A28L TaxID=1036674 RepID=UPI0002138CC8|nr:MBL fold metallo-hydrolase [Idiomarina sp. A28L]EGN74624.1 Putative exonuclease of the beta-lactamase fold involved in RNA processing [Idiomarina sp. A28L]
MDVIHHGAANGVTGSCHELVVTENDSVLIDIGLFQGAETSGADAVNGNAGTNNQEIDFPIDNIKALIITHCHIDHVGRLPWLLIAGYRGPIYCTRATAHLLPMVIEDALKVGLTRNAQLINAVLKILGGLMHPVDYDDWEEILPELRIRFRQAGHILGSSYVECEVAKKTGSLSSFSGTDFSVPEKRDNDPDLFVFSGDLGCKNSPLLPDPTPLERADMLVLESTYGNRNHENRAERQLRLKKVIEHCVSDRGAVLIPAFSIGRTQELLYELEDIIHQCKKEECAKKNSIWQDIVVIVDSPMAAEFTQQYRKMRDLWDAEALGRLEDNRHPLNFARMHIVNSHAEHERLVNYLKSTGEPCIIIAASGMCTGGRMVNYLEALLPDPRTDVLFVGFQAEGTPGRDIQRYGPRGGYVDLEGKRIWIKAEIHTLGGYSAHADQQELIEFIESAEKVKHVRLVHGDANVQREFRDILQKLFPDKTIDCACDL